MPRPPPAPGRAGRPAVVPGRPVVLVALGAGPGRPNEAGGLGVRSGRPGVVPGRWR